MKRKIIISLSLIFTIALMMSCTKQPYYDIPYDENGNVYITQISEVTADPVTTADTEFHHSLLFSKCKIG